MDQITTDSIEAELKDIVDSAESLAGIGNEDEANDQANETLGRLFAAIHKLNFLLQTQVTPKLDGSASSSNVAASQTTGTGASISDTGSAILSEFDTWIQSIKQALEKIAKFLKASQYSIGVQFPFSVSVSITFTP